MRLRDRDISIQLMEGVEGVREGLGACVQLPQLTPDPGKIVRAAGTPRIQRLRAFDEPGHDYALPVIAVEDLWRHAGLCRGAGIAGLEPVVQKGFRSGACQAHDDAGPSWTPSSTL